MTTLSLAAALVLAASAAETVAPACPEGARPRFTAHPFKVWSCPPKDAPAENGLPAEKLELDRKDKAADVRAAAGRWKGLVNYAGARYEVTLDLRRKGRGVEGEWTAMDYHTHLLRGMRGRLSPVWFDKGHLRGAVEAQHFQPLVIDAYAGRPSTTTASGYERRMTWTVGLGDRHDVLYTLAGDRLRFLYRWFPEKGSGPVGAMGELVLEKP